MFRQLNDLKKFFQAYFERKDNIEYRQILTTKYLKCCYVLPMLKITNTVFIEDDELEEKFIRSPGAGGQHVNKTSSSVQLRFNAKACPSISETVYGRLSTIASHLITQNGEIIITVHSHRSLQRNRDEAKERLIDLIKKATIVPKVRRATKPTLGSKKRRLEKKAQRGETKKNRGRVSKSDY